MRGLVLVTLLLCGCSDEPEKTMLLVDPLTGCKYVATAYGGNGVFSGRYFKPQTDGNGKQVCSQRIES